MTEAEWLACADPDPMLVLASVRSRPRKLRLFAVACCRRIWSNLSERSRKTLDFVERDVDGPNRILSRKEEFVLEFELRPEATATSTLRTDPFEAARDASAYALLAAAPDSATSLHAVERRAQSDFVRDIFGNPFRPVAFDPAWCSSTVTSLADAIYVERAFDRLPILADALEDAGCTSTDVLEHCRQPGEHARGCWVVDLVLGKS